MENKLIIGTFAMLLLGVVLVGASGYYSMSDHHKEMMRTGNFEEMHDAMMRGDFDVAEKYHDGFDCPMHQIVKDGYVSIEDFRRMQSWMETGNFPKEKPDDFSNELWSLHVSHHPEFYR